jgi:hypothetical protein
MKSSKKLTLKLVIWGISVVAILGVGGLVAGASTNPQPNSSDTPSKKTISPKQPAVKSTQSPKTQNPEPKSEENPPQEVAPNTNQRQNSSNQQSPGNPPPAPQSPVSNAPDPTRPWLTQADIDANRAQKAALEQQLISKLSELANVQAEIPIAVNDMNRFRVGGPEDDFALWNQAANRKMNLEARAMTLNTDIYLLDLQLRTGTWY